MGNESIKKKTQKLFIEPLEQRIMLDGAGASTFLDLIDERNQQQIKINSSNKDIYKEGENSNKDIPFTNITRDKIRNDKKNIVFIDSAVEDYETITSSFKENTEFYLINANEDGFKRISEILTDRENIDALHLIGHGSSGQILFGNAFLNNDTIDNYQATLASIGQSLTTSGDILFYGCNVASTEQGEILIKKISEITKADIAASDDITGKDGDWDLEKKIGIVETQNVKVLDYQSDLGISSKSSNVNELSSNDVTKGAGSENDTILIKLEKSNVSLTSTDYIGEFDVTQSYRVLSGDSSSGKLDGQTGSNYHYDLQTLADQGFSSATVNSYLVFTRANVNQIGNITFDGQILGIFGHKEYIGNHSGNVSNYDSVAGAQIESNFQGSSITYNAYNKSNKRTVPEHNSSNSMQAGIDHLFLNVGTSSSQPDNMDTTRDHLAIASTSGETDNKLWVSMRDEGDGDYWRVIVLVGDGVPLVSNNAPTSSDATININENNQESSAGDRTPSNITYAFSSSDFAFSDTDSGDAITHVKIVTLPTRGDLSYNSSNITTTDYEIAIGDIGNLVYTPDANSETDDSFTFTVSDGTVYSSTPNTITVSINAAPDADDIAGGSVAAGAASSGDVHGGVTDSDDDDSDLVVTGVAAGNEATNSTIITNDTGVGGDGVDGTYGSLTVAADGTYTYTASSTNNIAYGADATDTFTFTIRDDETASGSFAYDVGTITITVGASISLTNDDDTATEGTPITVTGAQDDVLNDDTVDTDGLVVTNISHDNGNESVSSGTTYANGASLAGDYGTLVIGADGSYTFTPNDVLGASETGTDVFTYTADGATATLSIEVTGINDAPTALDNSITTNEDTNHVFSTGEFNFSDDDNSGSLNKIKITSLEDNGALQYYNGSTWVDVTENQEITAADITSGYLRFKPDANENGADYTSFDFQVSDGTAYSSSSSTMTINVTPVNDAPTARDDTGIVNEDAMLTVSNSGNAISVAGASHDGTPYAIGEGSIRSLTFNHDGTKMFVVHASTPAVISEHALTTAFDITTASQSTTYDVSSHTTSPRGLRFNSDGTKLYLNSDESSNKKVYEFSLSTAYDISSLPTPSSTVISGQDGNPRGIAFNTDGSKMFLLGDENDTVYEYSLSTPFDTTTISYTNRSLDVSSKEVTPRGLSFNSTGTKLFITGQNSDDILEYDLSTGFNLSIASFNGAFDMTGTVSSPNDVVFNNDGSKAFIGQTGSNKIFSFSLSSPFSLVDITGENTGDVLDTSSSSNSDSDADASASLTVTAIRVGSSEDSGAAGSIGSALTGTYGQLTIAEDGSYSYVANQDAADALDAGDIVTDSFNYTVSDGTATDTAVITITVIGVNDAPTALDNSITTNEDTNHVFSTGEFNFSDDDNSGSLNKIKITSLEDNGALQYYNGSTWVDVTENQEITAADITSGYLRFKPDANENGTSYTSFDFQVSDGTAYSSSSSTMTINVTPVNDAPASSASSVTTNEDTTHTFTADDFSFTDDDGDTLSSVTVSALIGSDGTFLLDGVAITGSTTVSKADIDAGLLTFVPDANENGSSYNTFTFTVNDGTADSGSSTMTVNVTPVNDAPTSSDATININENNQESSAGDRTPSNITYTFSSSDFAFTDTESGAAITHVKIVDLPTSGTLNLSETAVTADEEIAIGDIGSLVYTPDANSETDDSFTFKVSDGTDYSTDPNTINVSVNAAPNVTDVTLSGTVAAGTQTSVGDIRRVINSIDVVADSDDDDSDLVVTGVAAGNESTNSTIITDGTGVGSGLVGTYGSLTILANGTYGYSAFSTNSISYGATATDTFTFTIRDDETASGSFAYDVGTITINVGASISLTNDDDTATEGTPITVTGAQDDVLNDDTFDTDGLVVTNISHDNGNESVSSGTTYANGASLAGDYGTLVIGANGSYTFTPNDVLGASETGTDVFTYTADGATATLSIEVTGTNDAPTITASTENNFIEGAASENDTVGVFDVSDIDTDDNSLTVTILSGNDNSYYQISYDDAGTATVTLTTAGANYVNAGNDLPEYTVQVSDGSLTATASHNPSVNLSPSVTDDSDTVTEGGTVQDTDGEGTVLSDDSDNEDTLSVSGTVTHTASDGSSVSGGNSDTAGGSSSIEGTYGTLTLDTDGSYSYVATTSSANALGAGDSGTDTFTFLVSDGNSTTSSTIQFTVNGVNDAPTTVPDTDSVAEGGTVVETTNSDTGTVLSDDNDEDGDTLSVSGTVTHTASDGSSVSGGNSDTAGGSSSIEGTYGTLTLDTDGSYSYVATTSSANALGAGDSGTDTFTFLVSDGTTTTSSTIQFTVNGVNDAPTARDDTGIVNEDATLTVSNSSDATTSVTAASFVRSKSLGDAGYQSMETKFSPDGTKMFVLDTYQNTNEIHQYTLTTAFDISSASFDGADETFDLSNENSSSSNFTFNNDGTKFYSAYSGRLYEYDVSTAYDISTSSYNNNFFDLILEFPNTGNMGAGVNVAFNSDGTKLFALDAHQREVHEYSLSTAFDVTSASRTNNYVSVGTQEASPYGFAFSNDGKKMFISGFGADVNEYTLSTGFDLSSTFEFVGSFDVSSKDSYPFGITFNNDGTKMFMTGSQQDKLFEYSLTTPFSLIDVSGEHSGDVINTSSTDNYDTDPEGDALTVTTYSHTSATDQDGGSISSTSSTGTAGTNNVTGYYGTLDLEGNGSYTYTADLTVTQALDSGDTVTDVFTYTVDDGNGGTDTATITITVIGMNDAPVAQNDVGVIVEDGTLRVTNSANANVSGSYDATGEHSGDVIDTSSSSHTDSDADASASLTVSAIRTGSSEGSGTAGSIGSALTGTYGQLTIAADGSYSYEANQDAAVGDSVTESFNYTLSDGTATDIGVITITILGVNDAGFIKEGGTLTVENSAAANSGASTGNHTGDITDNGSNITSITATTAGRNAQTTFSSNSETVIGEYGTLTINSDGSYSYVANSNISGLDAGDANIKDVFTYIVSDGSTTSTATLTMNIIASQDLTARDDNGTVNEDATLEVDDGDNLTTVAPASYDDSDSFTIAGSDSNPVTTQSTFNDLLFNPDGTKMYTLGSASGLSGRSLFQYTLSIPFDVSTASVSSNDNADVGGYELYNEAMRFNNDGTKLFVLSHPTHQSTRSYMYQYTLSTPYDITSTVTAGNSLLLGDQYDDFRTFLFNDDGSEMFIIETGYLIYKYTLSDPFDTSTASKTSSYLSAGNAVTGMQYNNDGTKLFTVHQTATIGSTAKILQWSLSTAYDLMTASSNVNWSDTSTYFDTGETTGSLGNGVPTQFITFNNDGSKFFSFNHTIGHGSSDPVKIKEWNLASPFNLTNDVSGEHSGDVINTSSTANYDTDPDSDTLTVTAIRTGSSEGLGTDGSIGSALDGTYGQLTIAEDGSYTYVANKDAADALDIGDVVTDTFNYTVSDGQGETDIAVLTITVNGVNDAPTAVADTDSVDAGSAVTDEDGAGTLVSNDTDPDASPSLYVTKITHTNGNTSNANYNSTKTSSAVTIEGTKGTLTFGSDGSYSYAANSDATSGDDVFTYTLTDGTSTSDTTLTISVTEIANNAPTITAQTDVAGAVTEITDGASGEGTNDLTDTGSFTIADLDNDNVTVSSAEGTTDAVGGSFLGALTTTVADDTDDGSGQINWTYTVADADVEYLEAGETVTETFTVTVSDGNGGTVDQTVTVVITGANDAPTLTTGAVDVDVNEASDASAQDLSSNGTITFADLDETTTITAATSTVTGSSGVTIPDAVNTALLSAITVTDNSNNTASWTLSASSLDLDFLTAGQTITLEKVVTATDGEDETVTDTITVTITGTNDTPTLTTGAVDVDVNEASDASAQDLSSNGTITFADLDETTTITAATSTVTGSSGVTIPDAVNTALLSAITVTDNSNNTASWTLSASSLDLDFLTAGQTITLEKVVTATDGEDETVTDTITVTITGTNDTPTLTTGAVDVDVNEASDASAQDLSSNGTITFADLDETTTITAATSTVTGSSGVTIPDAVNTALLSAITVTDNSNNTASWTLSASSLDLDFLTAGQTITLEKVVTATDGEDETVTDTITVTITGTNDTPTITAQTDVAGAVTEITDGASGEGTNDLTDTGSFTIADLDNDNVTVSSAEGTTDAVGGSFLGALTTTVADDTDDGSGQINWTYTVADADVEYLEAGETVTETFTVTVSDGNGGTVDQTVTVVITGANDAPTLTTGAVDVDVNEASDASAQDLSSNGTITFADLDETTTITAATSTVTGSSGVTIPDAVNTALLSAITVTDNSNNTASWTLSASSLDLDFLTAGQTITLEKVVTATDGEDETVTDTITVTITGTNDTPTLTTGAVDVDVNEASDASAQDLSSNGTITFADLDETTTITAATSTVTGSSGVTIPDAVNTALLSAITVTDNSNNTASWTLSASSLDLDFLTAGQTITLEKVVTATDGEDETVTDTITVTITGTNDTPTLTTGAVDVDVNEASDASAQDLSSNGTITFADLDETTTITAATSTVTGSSGVTIPDAVNTALLSAITVTDNSNNTASWTLSASSLDLDFLTAGQTITLEKVVTATDGEDETVTDTITVTITGTNDAPTANDDTISVAAGTPATGNVVTNDTDPDGDSLTVSAIAGGSVGSAVTGTYGTFTLNSDGSYTYTVDTLNADVIAWQSGDATLTETFTYTVSDGNGGTDTATITVNAIGQNDAPTSADNTVTTNEDTDHTFDANEFGFTDPDGDSLDHVTIETLPSKGTLLLDGSAVSAGDEIAAADITNLVFRPAADGNGDDYDSFTFSVNDGIVDSGSYTMTVNVDAVNDAPTITATTENDFTEGSTGAGDTVGVFDVSDIDTDDNSLTVTILSGNDNSYYQISYDDAGTATVTLTTAGANYVNAGNDLPEYTVQVSDGSLTATTSHNPTTLENTKPEASDNTITTLEDTSYTFSSNDFGFTDDDGNTLSSVTVSSLGTNGNGTFTLNGVAITGSTTVTKAQIDNGLLKFTPSSGDNGSSYNTYTFTVNDGTDDSSSSYTMTINVTAVNDAPVATDDESSVSEDSTVRVRANGDDLLNDDSDPENDKLKVSLIKVLGGSNNSISNGSSTTITGTYGQLTVNSNGGYTYRANQDAADILDTGESAKDIFIYTVSDGNGGTDTGRLTITINGVEDNPNAVKDNVSLNISENSTLTGNAITNDIDPDDSLTIVGCGQGRNPNNGSAKTVGTAFNSNYGQMTINADGTYTFVAASNIKELLDPGQSVTERFYYTISDGNSTSTAMIEVTVQRDNVVQELSKKEKKQIRKRIAEDRLNEPSTIRLLNKTTTTKTIEQTADALDSISNTKKLSFNEGIKLVDLVAETGSLTTDGSLDKVRAKEKDGQLNLKFKVSTDLGNQIVRYEGVMPDGSKLPDWIKVDPQTGKTTTNIPEGVELVDFIIVTTDQQNNKKEIAVSIDPKEIKADKEIFKQAKKQNASLSVDQSGNVNIVKTNESGEVNQTETKNLNANETQNLNNNIITQDLNLDNTNDIKNIIETIKSDQIYQLQTISNGEGLEIKVPETLLANFEKTKLVLKDGSAIPDWVEFNPVTGEINANPPEDVDKLEFKLIIERDGEIIVKDLTVDVGSGDNAQIQDDIEDTKFIAFKDQLNKEHENWEEYGSNIINRL